MSSEIRTFLKFFKEVMTMPKYRAVKAVKVIGKIIRGRKTVFIQLANGIIFAKSVPARLKR